MIRAAALDSSTVRGRSHCHTYDLHHSNNEFRADSLESTYAAAKEAGIQLLRVGAWMQETNPAREVFNWAYLDRVAELARELPTVLVLYHYDWPAWLSATEVLLPGMASAHMLRAAQQVAKRYPGVFHSYVPMCEVNFQAHMINSERWFPNAGGGNTSPEQVWVTLGRMLQCTAQGVRWGDPAARIATSEPFEVGLFDAHAHPMNLLARLDMLDIVGLNNYHPDQYAAVHTEAARRWPDKPIWLAEGGNIFQQHRPPSDWYEAAAAAGFDAMVYGPALPMLCFDHGHLVGQPLF